MITIDIERFSEAQELYDSYQTALAEVKQGYKQTHWIWYIFPQIQGLGHSSMSKKYAITSLLEAKAYLEDNTLRERLYEITRALLAHVGDEYITDMMSRIDAIKVCSSMTLFDIIRPGDVFERVINEFFEGKRCELTLDTVKAEQELYYGENAFEKNGVTTEPRAFMESHVSEGDRLFFESKLATVVDLVIRGNSMSDIVANYFFRKDFSSYRTSGVENTVNYYSHSLIFHIIEQTDDISVKAALIKMWRGYKDTKTVWEAADNFNKVINELMKNNEFAKKIKDFVKKHSLAKELPNNQDAVKPVLPKHLRTKVYGQTRTMVDMLIALNKEHHFESPQKAIDCLFSCLERLKEGPDEVAFNCSWRSIHAFVNECFENNKLNIDKLESMCISYGSNEFNEVYSHYVAEKSAIIISYLNEFRRYKQGDDIAGDFIEATGGVGHCGPNPSHYYFAFGGGMHYVHQFFIHYIRKFWDEISTDGVLDNAKFRDFMIERHERGIKKYGLENVISRNYKQDSACHPEVYVPYRGGAAPIYIKDEEHRRYIKSCGEGKGPNRVPDLFEFRLIEPLLREDSKYSKIDDYYIPKEDYTLPMYRVWNGRMYFENDDEKLSFIHRIKR